MSSSLGQRITDFRKKAGLSQKELADATGISLSAIGRYEGDKREPTAVVLMSLAKVLNITGDALLGLEPQQDLIAQNTDEASWLRSFRDLNAVGRNRALEYISCLKDMTQYTDNK